MNDITTIILTYNEEIHIERCIRNAQKFSDHIIVLDSFSTDNTKEIADSLGAEVIQHPFECQAQQLQWGLQNIPIPTKWVFRLDADEYLSDALIEEIKEKVATVPDDIKGFTAPRKMKFLGKEIKHGIIPMIILRLFQPPFAEVENKKMDEHILIREGKIADLRNVFYDDNQKGLTAWTQKHNNYASREAIELLITEYGLCHETVVNSGAHSEAIRKKKLKYVKLPLFWRAFAFFFLRYFIRLGFLDGKEGFLWHFLQGFWYRTLADAKVYELKKHFAFDDKKIIDYLKQKYL